MKLPKKEWEHCPNPDCNNQGEYMTGGIHYVTREMALDACEPSMEGMEIEDFEHVQCEFCWTNPKSVFYQENKLWNKQNKSQHSIFP